MHRESVICGARLFNHAAKEEELALQRRGIMIRTLDEVMQNALESRKIVIVTFERFKVAR